MAATVKGKKGVSVFDDHKGTYWYEFNPTVDVPDAITRIKIVQGARSGSSMIIAVGPSV